MRHFQRWQLEVLGRHERSLEELGGVDVRKSVLCQLSDRDGVAPGPLVVLRVEKVEREQGRELHGALLGAMLEHGADAPVDLAPAAEGKPLVRNRTEEIVAEPQFVRPLPGHELPEPAPAVEVADVLELVRQHVREEIELEASAEDRGVAKEKSIAGLERVDPRRDQRLDRLWKRRNAAPGPGGRDELAHEERVATRALRDLSEQLLGEGDLSSGREREPSRLLARERRELEEPMPVVGLVTTASPAGGG